VTDAGRAVLDDLSLTVRAGEIVGIAGISGNGQTELMDVLAGTRAATSGKIRVADTEITDAPVARRLAAGLGRLTEDRRGSVVATLSVEQNLCSRISTRSAVADGSTGPRSGRMPSS
jgi:simple sugar transport system ATP-binding protein